MIQSPEGTTLVPLAPFDGALKGVRYIAQARDGWLLVASQPEPEVPAERNAVVVNVKTGAAHLVSGPPDFGDAMAMYCDSVRHGYVASDRSVLFSKIDDQGLRVLRYPVGGGEPQTIGKPIIQVALINVGERAGGFVVTGSDGSDTY